MDIKKFINGYLNKKMDINNIDVNLKKSFAPCITCIVLNYVISKIIRLQTNKFNLRNGRGRSPDRHRTLNDLA